MSNSENSNNKGELDRLRSSQLKEKMIAHRLVRLGYRPIAWEEDGIREYFEFTGKCADLTFSNRAETCLIVESKGMNFRDAFEQLQNTAIHVAKKYRHVEAQIVLSWPGIPPSQVSVGKGYVAIKQPLNPKNEVEDDLRANDLR